MGSYDATIGIKISNAIGYLRVDIVRHKTQYKTRVSRPLIDEKRVWQRSTLATEPVNKK